MDEKKLNEFKFSALRNFGSENISFTATVYSVNMTLSEEELQAQVDQVGSIISKGLKSSTMREITEKGLFAETSKMRREAVAKLDEALKEEIKAAEDAKATTKKAEKLGIKSEK